MVHNTGVLDSKHFYGNWHTCVEKIRDGCFWGLSVHGVGYTHIYCISSVEEKFKHWNCVAWEHIKLTLLAPCADQDPSNWKTSLRNILHHPYLTLAKHLHTCPVSWSVMSFSLYQTDTFQKIILEMFSTWAWDLRIN